MMSRIPPPFGSDAVVAAPCVVIAMLLNDDGGVIEYFKRPEIILFQIDVFIIAFIDDCYVA